MAKVKEKVDQLGQASAEIKLLESKFARLEDLQAVAKKINFAVMKSLSPMLRQMLIANYTASGIDVKSGELKKAVAGSYITIGKKGIRIVLPPDESKKVYVRASVFRKYKNFYNLSSSDVARLQSEFVRLWQIEVKKYIDAK